MTVIPPTPGVLRFEVFEVDLRTEELRKRGQLVWLPGQSFQVLRLVLERPGELVSREELREKLWGANTFVDFEHGLNAAVNRLREKLGDSATAPKYIETLQGRGYRFIAEVRSVANHAELNAPIEDPKDCALRYQHASEMRADLQRVKRDTDSSTPLTQTGANAGAANDRPTGVSVATPPKRSKGVLAAVALGIALLIMGSYGLRTVVRGQRGRSPFLNLTVTRVTDNGRSSEAAISPDGKYLLSVVEEHGRKGLVLTHLPTNSNTQVASSGSEFYYAPSFSPDGNYFYFLVARSENSDISNLMRAPVLGGTPQLIAQNATTRASFSPESRQIAYGRENSPYPGMFQILVADADGKNEKALLTIPQAELGHPDFRALAWSPAGKFIALTANPINSPHRILLLDAASGHSTAFAVSEDRVYGDIAWAPEDRGVYVMYSNRNTSFDRRQIGYASMPDGQFWDVTRDTNSYAGLTLPADGQTIGTSQHRDLRSFFVIPSGGMTSGGQPAPLLQTDKAYHYWALGADSEIYVAGPGKLTRVTLNGGKTVSLMEDPRAYFLRPQGCWDVGTTGAPKYVVFELYGRGAESGADKIWRIGPDGSHPTQLTSGDGDYAPTCSPDGTVFYIDSGTNRIMEVSLEGGQRSWVMPGGILPEGVALAFQNLQISPDGKTLSTVVTVSREKTLAPQHKIAFVSIGAFANVARRLIDPDPRISGPAIFTQDNRALIYAISDNGVGNLWEQPIDGAPGRQITSFPSDLMGYYQLSRDGKSLFLNRRHEESDIVLLRDTGASP